MVKRSLAPTWNENFTFALDPSERNQVAAYARAMRCLSTDLRVRYYQELKIECYDYDMVGDHDFIGGLSLNTNDLKMRQSDWFKLVHPDNPGELCISVRCHVQTQRSCLSVCYGFEP